MPAGVALAVVSLLLVYAIAAASSVRQKSIVFDELGHLTGGASVWAHGDYRLFPQNGQFPQRWATLPLVVQGIRFPSIDQVAWRRSNLEAMGSQFLYGVGNDTDALLWSARMTMLPLAVVLGLVCWVWARRLFGDAGGLVALAIFVCSPSMLAHGPLATSDVAAALMFTASLGCVWQALHHASPARVAGSGLVMGLLFVTKMSAMLMAPVVLLLAAFRIWNGRAAIWSHRRRVILTGRRRLSGMTAVILLVHGIIVLAVIWAFYGFRYSTFQGAAAGRNELFLGETLDSITEGESARPGILLAGSARLLPEAYLFGFAHVLDRSGKFIGFINGQYRLGGWWYFFPYTSIVKTPLPVFALLGLALGAGGLLGARRGGRTRLRLSRRLYRLLPLVVFVAAYWTSAVASDLNLGERHVLPTYPALFILAGGAAREFGRRRPIVTAAVGASVLLLSIESVSTWPHYLSYFNVLAGGPSAGYRHLVDSSLDWGQDLPGLKRWIDRERRESPSRSSIYLSYFGSGNPAQAGIEAIQVYSYQDWRAQRPLHDLAGGIYCVSATMLQSVYTRVPGPWAAPYEEAYQAVRREIARVRAADGDAADGREAESWNRLVASFEELRWARLAAYLRHREPDDEVGYSILVFRLSDEDLRDALDGPPAELRPDIGIDDRRGLRSRSGVVP